VATDRYGWVHDAKQHTIRMPLGDRRRGVIQMTVPKRAASLVVAGALVVALSGCVALDVVIWGPGGARVIATTEAVIDAASDGDFDAFACDDSVADFGEPADWEGRSAGEPERFVPEYHAQQVALDPAWSINLELGPEEPAPGLEFPGEVFYRETDDGLCVIDIGWATVVG
jgi:hypothetical protein